MENQVKEFEMETIQIKRLTKDQMWKLVNSTPHIPYQAQEYLKHRILLWTEENYERYNSTNFYEMLLLKAIKLELRAEQNIKINPTLYGSECEYFRLISKGIRKFAKTLENL